jgi:pyruvate kinase
MPDVAQAHPLARSASGGVKIVCTLGPRSSSREVLRRMVRAGMDVARINFSHGSHAEHAERVAGLREVAESEGRAVAVLQDLRGPKIRIGDMADGTLLEREAPFALQRGVGTGGTAGAFVDDALFFEEVRPRDHLLLADGLVELAVESVTPERVSCRVVAGGPLASRKGVNVPRGLPRRPALEAKDLDDLAFGLRMGVDYVGVSYVRNADDVALVRAEIARLGADTPIVAKIETAAAIANLDAILDAADAVMLARGDLALETPYERVPMEQKRILEAANRRGRPVITATQMLVSMVHEPRPTRAEVNDVANAVLDGTDAVMLSEETAVGDDPPRVVEVMARIVRATEGHDAVVREAAGLPQELHPLAAVATAAARIARELGARAVITWSSGGLAARLLSRARPAAPIIALTPSIEAARRLAIVRDVTAVPSDGDAVRPSRVQRALGVGPGDTGPVVVFGHSLDDAGHRLAWIRVARLEEPSGWVRDPGAREPARPGPHSLQGDR